MANYYGKPQSIAAFLSERAQKAMAEIGAMTKGHLVYSSEDYANTLITRYKVEPLALGQHTPKIPESHPNQLEVIWPFTGDKQLASLYNNNGQYIQSSKFTGQYVKEVFTYSSPITASEHNQLQAKNDIEKAATAFREHFSRLNAKIEEFNQLIAERIPNSVKLKHEALTKIKAAEDFLK
ncbi:MAG: hypothetical protein ACRYFZ_18130 [Janthinobacterium lividum]